MKTTEAIPAINALLEADIPGLLTGAPGIGKSEIVAAVAKARGADFVDIRLSLFDPVDLRGLPMLINGETVWQRPAIWPRETGRETVLFLDEIDRASPAVMSAAMQLVLDRKIGEHVLPAGVRILAANNGRTDKVGTNRMPSALANRFCHLDIDADAQAWAEWALAAGVAPELVGFINFRPALLHVATMDEADRKALEDRAFPSPRAWVRVAKLIGQPDALRHTLAAGLVGKGPAAEFEGFVRTMRGLPSLAAVLADPMGAPLVTDPGAQYAMSAALARRAAPDNFAAVLAYAARMPREFEILTAIDSTKRNPALLETRAYTDFAVRNAPTLGNTRAVTP